MQRTNSPNGQTAHRHRTHTSVQSPIGMGGGEETFSKGGSLAETHHKLIELLQEDIKEEITAWKLPLGDKLWLPAAEALKANTKCRRLTIYECDIGAGERRVHNLCLKRAPTTPVLVGARSHVVRVCGQKELRH